VTFRIALALLSLALLPACGEKTCETDLDCVIICTCQPSGREATVAYECSNLGLCGTSFDADLDCVRPCDGVPPIPLDGPDDDDAVDDDDVVDDDDSAARR
jgi:hypothetical protein